MIKCPYWIIFKNWLGLDLASSERSQHAHWITRKVKTPKGLNAHDVCEMEWENNDEMFEL